MQPTAHRRTRIAAVATAAGAIAATVLTGAATAQAATRGQHDHGRQSGPAHVFYIMMENHGYSQIIGNNADAPYINSLAAKYNVATDFHGVTHPSLPNYLAMLSGSHQGIWDDCAINTTCAPEEF